MIRYYRWRSSYLGGMVCVIRGVGGVVCGGGVVCVKYTVACYVYRGDRSEHRVVYRSVVSIEGYTGPEWA